MRRFGWIIGLALCASAVWALQFSLRAAPLGVEGGGPAPAALGAFADDPPIQSAEDWAARRAPILRDAFQRFVYGALPPPVTPRLIARRLIDAHAYGGIGRAEQITLDVIGRDGAAPLHVVLLTPNTDGPAPLVIVPNFCGNAAAFGGRYANLAASSWLAPRCRSYAGRALTRALHGANIVRPPFEDLLRDGYAVATYSPGDIAPDDPNAARRAFEQLNVAGQTGTISAWAWSISRVIDALEREPSIDVSRIAVFGHSRFGKAALWAAALDMRVALVIANQSGRLGASPTHSPIGERISQLVTRYPHWFPESAATPTDIDQHLLLALIAPRPILLGGAGLDRWSDPAGAFRAAAAASPVYELYGHVGLDQPDLRSPNLDADIALFVRSGGHGVRPSDWNMARAFLDAHFKD